MDGNEFSGETRRFDQERYFTLAEVAERLGYRDDQALRAAIKKGKLRAFRPSPRHTVVGESDLERWLAGSLVEAAPPQRRSASQETKQRARGREVPLLGRAVRA